LFLCNVSFGITPSFISERSLVYENIAQDMLPVKADYAVVEDIGFERVRA
jgi:hypothetical protein